MRWREIAEAVAITFTALGVSLVLFAVFVGVCAGVAPDDLFYWIYIGAFGTPSSWRNTLTRAAPLILTGLCTALPARLGLISIGGEGALALGGLAAVSAGLALEQAAVPIAQLAMAGAGMLAGGLFVGLVGVLRAVRGLNVSISSLVLSLLALAVFNFAVEGPMYDPDSLNKPSTYPIPDEFMLGDIPGLRVHWGLAFGVLCCLLAYVLMEHTTFGFAARIASANPSVAQLLGLRVGWMMVVTCFLGGAAGGLTGMVEVTAVHGRANATIIAGYGFTGVLVSFMARHQPLAIIPVAMLFGGFGAAAGVFQRRLGLPDASVQVLMGTIFVVILLFETLYGRFRIFWPPELCAGLEEDEPPTPACRRLP